MSLTIQHYNWDNSTYQQVNMCVVILTGKAPLLAIMNTFKCKKCTQQWNWPTGKRQRDPFGKAVISVVTK